MTLTVTFDTQHLYYLPQYLPVADKLRQQGVDCGFTVYGDDMQVDITRQAIKDAGFRYQELANKKNALAHYASSQSNWVVFGNVPAFSVKDKEQIDARLVLMQHGIGPKACYYDVSEYPFDVRFVEGQERLKRLEARFPQRQFVDTGYAKLDPVFNNEGQSSPTLADLGLDPAKPTLLYAPTFFPSSIEHLPSDWPQQLAQYNLIIKPHYFSLTKPKYRAQRDQFSAWQQYKNVYFAGVEDYNLVPFMKLADVMLSDASSAIFEFAALDKPVIWCDFYRTRWSYSGLFKFRLKQRLDPDIEMFHELATRAKSAKHITKAVAHCLKHPNEKKAAREDLVNAMVGKTDGNCGARIVDYLISHA